MEPDDRIEQEGGHAEDEGELGSPLGHTPSDDEPESEHAEKSEFEDERR